MTEIDRGALVDQRDFLLRSLEDLEREHDAGDVDEHDYLALKDDYTARAAHVLRALEVDHPQLAPAPRRRSWRRTGLAVVGVGAFAVLAGVAVAHVSGRRDPGQTLTGGIRQSVTESLNQALRESQQGSYAAALDEYAKVLKEEPDNVEALTYRGWVLTLSGDIPNGLSSLIKAATTNPKYPDAHAFLAVVLFRSGLLTESSRELDRLDALNPPPDILRTLRALAG